MTKKILISLGIIGIVAAVTVGLTTAYFSDTETSTGNVFAAGTIDIHLTDLENNTWTGGALMEDMKPCYTDYVNFKIYNDDSEDANPVNVWKKLTGFVFDGGTLSEPECWAGGGEWIIGGGCSGGSYLEDKAIARVVLYDLVVRVYDDQGEIWWQTIYDEDVTVGDVKNNKISDKGMYLGMIPAGGYMEVEQSYHMDPDTGNWAQGDSMTFNIEIYAEQLHGVAWLENKDVVNWHIHHDDGIKGILTYNVKHPTFDFEFDGTVPNSGKGKEYTLVAITDIPANTGVALGTGTADASNGSIYIEGDEELGQDIKDAKVWLLPSLDWLGSTTDWGNWTTDYLWETGLIWYEDTDK